MDKKSGERLRKRNRGKRCIGIQTIDPLDGSTREVFHNLSRNALGSIVSTVGLAVEAAAVFGHAIGSQTENAPILNVNLVEIVHIGGAPK